MGVFNPHPNNGMVYPFGSKLGDVKRYKPYQ
jgi:hypothetical protein